MRQNISVPNIKHYNLITMKKEKQLLQRPETSNYHWKTRKKSYIKYITYTHYKHFCVTL